MNNVFNFRDLGGIPTMDGRTIKKDLFYRSGHLDKSDDSDIAFLNGLGLVNIFDYRDNDEVDSRNETIYTRIGANHRHYPNKITKGKVYKLQIGGLNRAFIHIKTSDVCEFYSYLPFNNNGYKSMVSSLVKGDVPFLQHCTAGKDRAGMGSALLLAILGVSYDEIVKDYLESLAIYPNIRALIFDQIPKSIHWFLKNNYEPLFIVDKAYIDAARDAIIKKYGSFEKYLFEEYNLDESKIKELRNKYTE